MKHQWYVVFNSLLLILGSTTTCRGEWLERVSIDKDKGAINLSAGEAGYFLEYGEHSYHPDSFFDEDGKQLDPVITDAVPIALFQGLRARKIAFTDRIPGKRVHVAKRKSRDAFWDQVITVKKSALASAPRYRLIEAGKFGVALLENVRSLDLSAAQIAKQQASLQDPHLPPAVDHELSWSTLESFAYPLDFQKVLLASANDSSPGFAFQNGQWLTTWLSQDLPKWTKEDHWFAPALLIGDQLVRPAPLSAKTNFMTTADGKTLPRWTLEWQYKEIKVRQSLFSQPVGESGPHVHVKFDVENGPENLKLALGVGRRPNVHYWDNLEHERTAIPFFTLAPKYRKQGKALIDPWDKIVLESAQDFTLETIGPVEMLLTFTPTKNGSVYLRTPQSEVAKSDRRFSEFEFLAAQKNFESFWSSLLNKGAQALLPDIEWMKRIDIWKSQVAGITRVNYQDQERLSYGAYFYQAYFGPEEGWPIVALAQWGQADEAKRQAEIMLSAENRSKENVHHQSRNGAFAWYAAEVARLADDQVWLQSIAPALIENADWTIKSIKESTANNQTVTRGLLPPHIYGGDIRDPATSLYASAVCWKGLSETADIFRTLGAKPLQQKASNYETAAVKLNTRLNEVIKEVANRSTQPPFVPLALSLPSLDGKHEGPYEHLTASRLGNYWNLFASSVLELGFPAKPAVNLNDWLLGYMETHGGLWAGLPRFNHGLDAAYSIGVINDLMTRSIHDVKFRNQALASLQSFFLHAASRNGFTIPEVAGLFPYRLNASAYEQLVREAPWNFGMYDTDRYIDGHISFTEPLGAAAGEALWMIRNALVAETRNEKGLPSGEVFLLSTVPSDWFSEGKEIKLEGFPTYYGTLSIQVRSTIESAGEVEMAYHFVPNSNHSLKQVIVRFAPPGFTPQDIAFVPEENGLIGGKFVIDDQ